MALSPVTSASGGGWKSEAGVIPAYVAALEAIYGRPNQNGFGSTVLFTRAKNREDVMRLAREAYRYFAGDLWEKWGEAGWLANWQLVHERTGGRNIAEELESLSDPAARSSADLILNVESGAGDARAALTMAFDDPDIENLLIFILGDGNAMSGLLVGARRKKDEAVFLVFLID